MVKKQSIRSGGFGQQVKKFFLSAFVVLSFIAYIIHQRHPTTAVPNTGTNNAQNVNAIPTLTLASQAGSYKDGTFTGPVTDAFYGPVQVQVVIQSGKITNVQFLQYPNDRQTSQQINAQAMPWLTQEAIQAQSANINVITGATLTSEAFYQSLQVALQSANK